MIKTRSQFYYGLEITIYNQYIDFQEGSGPVLQAKLALGQYSHSELIIELAKKMNEIGDGLYVWDFNRTEMLMSVSCDINFKLLCGTGSHSTSGIWEMLGFDLTDKTGSNAYTGTQKSGSNYRPTFYLQNYVSTEQNISPVESSLNKTGSGRRELVIFGLEKLMECEIYYITNFYQPEGGPIEYDSNAFSNCKSFMDYIIKGGHFEFMENRANPNIYETLQLKSTSDSQDGISYRIEEMVDKGLQGYYRLNKLVFRKIEV